MHISAKSKWEATPPTFLNGRSIYGAHTSHCASVVSDVTLTCVGGSRLVTGTVGGKLVTRLLATDATVCAVCYCINTVED